LRAWLSKRSLVEALKGQVMKSLLTGEDRRKIQEGIRKKYAKVAVTPEGSFRYPTGKAALEKLKYDPQLIKALPEEAIGSYCGVGNPFHVGPIHKGESVLDVGCGGGVDTLVAGMIVGPTGKVIGIDVVTEILERARENLKKTSLDNARFQESSPEALPFPDGSFDVVISNGAFNLIPDKVKALEEAFRVLKSSGRLMIADQILTGELPDDKEARIEKWAR
jgi:arsenite methyltransferase